MFLTRPLLRVKAVRGNCLHASESVPLMLSNQVKKTVFVNRLGVFFSPFALKLYVADCY